ncbi:hypothetical protein E2C01_018977 [Portunus trituberculatus]|uniref:Uncharacterized protein n=1 Tax=Portunus trituberculatus TaxID=210409 RepID=A0A5B7DX21_PORTR|nr:hypothetical protein [Portunus trituberculatus]
MGVEGGTEAWEIEGERLGAPSLSLAVAPRDGPVLTTVFPWCLAVSLQPKASPRLNDTPHHSLGNHAAPHCSTQQSASHVFDRE